MATVRQFVPSGSKVLDAGCGYGEWVVFLSREGYAVEGLDFSEELVRRLDDEYPNQTWLRGTIQEIPQLSSTYDAVISWGVIEHDEDGPGAALAEFRRVLRPGGVAIVTVPVDTVRQRRASSEQFPEGRGESRFFQYFFTADELEHEVAQAGFRIAETGIVPEAHEALVFPRAYARLSGSRVAARALRAAKRVFPSNGSENMIYCVGRVPVDQSQPPVAAG